MRILDAEKHFALVSKSESNAQEMLSALAGSVSQEIPREKIPQGNALGNIYILVQVNCCLCIAPRMEGASRIEVEEKVLTTH